MKYMHQYKQKRWKYFGKHEGREFNTRPGKRFCFSSLYSLRRVFSFIFPQEINKCYPFIIIDYFRYEIFNFLRYPNFLRSKGFRRFPKITERFRDDFLSYKQSEFTSNGSMSKKLFLSVRNLCECVRLEFWIASIMCEGWQVYKHTSLSTLLTITTLLLITGFIFTRNHYKHTQRHRNK